jgi:ADP-ribose pyrophosphatase YjhB (NUDIX family)
VIRQEAGVDREYCEPCNQFFYDNPIPVASNIVLKERELLLVKRKLEPGKGLWCLPMGFAETGETIEDAALRELKEEAGISGKITGFVNVESGLSKTYGDLLFLTFETEWMEGELQPGDDAQKAMFFPFDGLPELAFSSNINAIEVYLRSKEELWSILDSFTRSFGSENATCKAGDFLSDKLIRLIEENAEVITGKWLRDVKSSKSTPTYANHDPESSLARNKLVLSQFGKWLGGYYSDNDIRKLYRNLGRERQKEGFSLSELVSALSLTRKHIWEFALAQNMWKKTIDIYMTLELERRMMLFFDKAAYHITKGYEQSS